LLIENILGFDIIGKGNLIKWSIKRTDKHGIKNIQLDNQKVTLIFEIDKDKPKVYVKCEMPFSLYIEYNNKEYKYDISETKSNIYL